MTIGAVVVSRNDDYGYNLKERAILSLNSLIEVMDEVIYVDWNSQGKSLISEIRNDLIQSDKFKWIVITPEKAKELLKNQPSQDCVEVLGRNIGIRRLTTDFILSTNIDVIVPPKSMFDKLADKDIFYIGARRDIPLAIAYDATAPKDIYQQVGESGAYVGDVWSLINNCGDFQYAHRDIWYNIKGFEESLIGRGFSDSNVQKKASLHRYSLKVVRDIPIYHITHRGGFGGTGIINNVDLALKNFTETTNKDTWGFSDQYFKLYTFKDKTDMQFASIKPLYNKNKNTPSDINEHLEFLYTVTCNIHAKKILEFGVRSGQSTSAFLSAIEEMLEHDSHSHKLWSCDLNMPYGDIEKYIGQEHWIFQQGNDLDNEIYSKLPDSVDIVFIDTGHFFDETLEEMEKYYNKLKKGGLMILHDSNEPQFIGEYAAIRVFLDRHKECDFYNFINNHGLAVISKDQKFNEDVKVLFK